MRADTHETALFGLLLGQRRPRLHTRLLIYIISPLQVVGIYSWDFYCGDTKAAALMAESPTGCNWPWPPKWPSGKPQAEQVGEPPHTPEQMTSCLCLLRERSLGQ